MQAEWSIEQSEEVQVPHAKKTDAEINRNINVMMPFVFVEFHNIPEQQR